MARQLLHNRLHDRLDLIVGQRSVITVQGQAHGQAFFAVGHARNRLLGTVNVKQQSITQQPLRGRIMNGLHDGRMGDRIVHDHRDVAFNGLEP